MVCRLLAIVVGLLSIGLEARSSIKWAKYPGKGLAFTPKIFLRQHFGSSAIPQKLTIGQEADSIAPYFTPKPDNTISAGSWCVEAAGEQSGDVVIVNACSGGASLHWNLIPDGHGRNMIQLKGASLCLEVVDGDALNGAAVELLRCEPSVSNSWIFSDPARIPSDNASFSPDLRNMTVCLWVIFGLGFLSLRARLCSCQRKRRLVNAYHGQEQLIGDQGGICLTVSTTANQGSLRPTSRSDVSRRSMVPAAMVLDVHFGDAVLTTEAFDLVGKPQLEKYAIGVVTQVGHRSEFRFTGDIRVRLPQNRFGALEKNPLRRGDVVRTTQSFFSDNRTRIAVGEIGHVLQIDKDATVHIRFACHDKTVRLRSEDLWKLSVADWLNSFDNTQDFADRVSEEPDWVKERIPGVHRMVETLVREIFGSNSHIWIAGSRNKHTNVSGSDIDLVVALGGNENMITAHGLHDLAGAFKNKGADVQERRTTLEVTFPCGLEVDVVPQLFELPDGEEVTRKLPSKGFRNNKKARDAVRVLKGQGWGGKCIPFSSWDIEQAVLSQQHSQAGQTVKQLVCGASERLANGRSVIKENPKAREAATALRKRFPCESIFEIEHTVLKHQRLQANLTAAQLEHRAGESLRLN